LQQEPYKRPIIIGLVNITVFPEAMTAGCIAIKTLKKGYHRGFCDF
jgi:hypothetical protein